MAFSGNVFRKRVFRKFAFPSYNSLRAPDISMAAVDEEKSDRCNIENHEFHVESHIKKEEEIPCSDIESIAYRIKDQN